MMTTTIQPRVYVACLAAYNNGILHGRWIDADQDVEDLGAEIQEMLKASPIPGAEEWAVHDYEYIGRLSEYPGLEKISQRGLAVAEHGEAYLAWLNIADDPETEDFEDQYVGSGYDSEREYAEQYVGELGWAGIQPTVYRPKDSWDERTEVNPLEALESYIDWDKVAQELFDHGPYNLVDGYVFRTY